MQGAVAPMFPDEDEWLHGEWDDYGAAIRKEDFMVGRWHMALIIGLALQLHTQTLPSPAL